MKSCTSYEITKQKAWKCYIYWWKMSDVLCLIFSCNLHEFQYVNIKASFLHWVDFNFSCFLVFCSKSKTHWIFLLEFWLEKQMFFRITNSWYKRKKLHQNLTFMSIRKNSSYAINVHQMNGLSRISIQIEKQALELSRPWRLMTTYVLSIYTDCKCIFD